MRITNLSHGLFIHYFELFERGSSSQRMTTHHFNRMQDFHEIYERAKALEDAISTLR